jgi:hypothetical protein
VPSADPEPYATVRRAIAERRQMVAEYGGHRRELCPHAIGHKDGKPHALFWQFAGGSSQTLPAGGAWRCLPLAGLTIVEVRAGAWHGPRLDLEAQSCIDAIDLAAG